MCKLWIGCLLFVSANGIGFMSREISIITLDFDGPLHYGRGVISNSSTTRSWRTGAMCVGVSLSMSLSFMLPHEAFAGEVRAAPIPIDYVTVARSSESTHVFGYAARDVAVEVAIWLSDGEPRLAVTMPDGSYLFAAVHDGDVTIDSNDFELIEAQLGELEQTMDLTATVEQAGWVDCGLEVVGTGLACAGVQAVLCVVGSIASACTCLPLVVEEFEDMDCPGFG